MIRICDNCGKKLDKDTAALNQKLMGTETEIYLCLGCLAEELDTSEEELQAKIEDFKEEGCVLFD